MAEFVERKVFWETKLGGSGAPREIPPRAGENARVRDDAGVSDISGGSRRVWIGDPAEAQYLQTTPAHVIEIAARLVAAQGLIRMDGEYAEATAGLMHQVERFENARLAALEELEKKHAFERG
jgi:hypothetical protein